MSQWYPVSSSNVEAIREEGGALEVMFLATRTQPRRTWRWDGAGYELYAMLQAPSKGKHVWNVIRVRHGTGHEV